MSQNYSSESINSLVRATWQVPEMDVCLWVGKKNKYCVVIPVINEGERIKNLLQKMQDNRISSIADIIIIDGGSTDGSLNIATLQSLDVCGLIVKKGPGKLSAQLRCAYAFALDNGYQGIVTIDGNDKDDPQAIPDFIAALEEGVDFVQASRFVSGGVAENTPKSRDFAIRYIHAPALTLSSGFKWTDTTQGFRAYSRKMLLDHEIAPFRNIFCDYELLAYLSHRAPQLNYHCVEIGTSRKYPKGEVPTKISAIRGNWKVLQTLAKACFGCYNVKKDDPKDGVINSAFIYFTCAVGFLFSVLAFYPGWMSPDSFAHYVDARANLYHDWQPVLMAWLWRQFDGVYAGPAPMLLLHLLMYWGGWLLLALGGRRWLSYGAYAIPLLGFWPGILFPLGQIWKDIGFAVAMFLAWAYLFYLYSGGKRAGVKGWIVVFTLSVYAIGIKPNGLVVLPFLYAVMSYVQNRCVLRWRPLLLMVVFLPTLSVFTVFLLTSRLDVIKTNSFQYTQTYDLLGISIKSNKVLLPDYVTKRVGSTIAELKTMYWSGGNNAMFYNKDGNISTTNQSELDELKKRWISAISRYPYMYLEHRWSNFIELLRWGSNNPAYVAIPKIDENNYGFSFHENAFSDWLASTPKLYPYMFLPWIYSICLLVAGLWLFAFSRQQRFFVFCFTGSGLAFIFPHVLIAPAADYRYLYYAYFCSIVLGYFALVAVIKWTFSHFRIK
ncbi:glycosyltransferase [Plesiomonas shigelloides]|uniref:Glycosyltransferase family 2 protein n=1 Tax=Plesiomonas shigelloides TaxID=703 RepID=A0A4D6U7H3_PLESH|nr:glycosyltransferase family 2 protein [Plesiomonas shigelloides]KAB7690400.1 glycosyltransferase [Plesiomonas shigelloides]QCH03191.1 glycosyltransferase family 2 protein [Plesiomonas shigelloides]